MTSSSNHGVISEQKHYGSGSDYEHQSQNSTPGRPKLQNRLGDSIEKLKKIVEAKCATLTQEDYKSCISTDSLADKRKYILSVQSRKIVLDKDVKVERVILWKISFV